MSRIGGVGGRGGGGGKVGGPKGAGGPAGASKAGKASGAGFGKVDRLESLVGPSGAAGADGVAPTDPITAGALEIARQVKAGQISREEAAKKLVANILEERLRLKSKALTGKIVEQMNDDPRLNQTLQRLWERG